MILFFDGRNRTISDDAPNLVEAARELGVGIPAPCYRSREKTGCCGVCHVLVNGKAAYACCTRPREGMVVEVTSPAVRRERNLRARHYRDTGTAYAPCGCDSGCDCSPSGSGCC